MALKYSSSQHIEYMNMLDRVGMHWLHALGDRSEFRKAGYYDMFVRMWRRAILNEPVLKSEAASFVEYVKTPKTQAEFLQRAIDARFIEEREIVQQKTGGDGRKVNVVVLSEEFKQRLDEFFDLAIEELNRAHNNVHATGDKTE